jgi:alkylation response protein AidB-like acyl-CoA dehydrogenase
MLGKEGDGFKIAMKTLDGGRIGIAAQALGIAQGAYEQALSYAKKRHQFGQPIGRFQAVQFKLADMATQIDAARFLVYRAAWCVDNKLPYTKEAAMAKCFASDVAMWVSTEAIQVLGGYGYVKDYPVERMMRDAKITQIYEGTNEIQRMVIGANLMK